MPVRPLNHIETCSRLLSKVSSIFEALAGCSSYAILKAFLFPFSEREVELDHISDHMCERGEELDLLEFMLQIYKKEARLLNATINDLQSPVKRLPAEILTNVLLQATAEDRNPDSVFKKTLNSCLVTCRAWNSVIASNPHFWTVVICRVGLTRVDGLRQQLQRSKTLPIHFTISHNQRYNPKKPANCIEANSWSWNDLLGDSTGRVRHIAINASPSSGKYLPIPAGFTALERLEIHGANRQYDQKSSLNDFSHSTNANLRSLTIKECSSFDISGLTPTPSHSYINELTLHNEYYGCSLQTILRTFPHLRSLDYRESGESNGMPVEGALDSCSLERLILRGSTFPTFPQTSTLKEIFCTNSVSSHISDIGALTTLPCVRTLGFSDNTQSFRRQWLISCPNAENLVMGLSETNQLSCLQMKYSEGQETLAPKLRFVHLYCGTSGELKGTSRAYYNDDATVPKLIELMCALLVERPELSITISYGVDRTLVGTVRKFTITASRFPGRLNLVEADGPPFPFRDKEGMWVPPRA